MMKKLPVKLNPYIKTRYAYKKLKICRKCGHFTVLGDSECEICGRDALVSVDDQAAAMVSKSMWKQRIIAVIIWGIGMPFSSSSKQLTLYLAAGAVLLALLWFMQRRSFASEAMRKLEQLLQEDANKLIAGLAQDREAAIEVFHEGDKPLAYEMLREIGALVHTDQLRVEQILLLQSFSLRKDMDLMLEPLLMDHFNPDLAAYIGELAKIKRELLKEKAFRYLLVHEASILGMDGGEDILVGAAGAAVRMRRYVVMYPYLIMRYARKLPKERFLRLYRMVAANPAGYGEQLVNEVFDIYNEKYKWDNDFTQKPSRIAQRGEE